MSEEAQSLRRRLESQQLMLDELERELELRRHFQPKSYPVGGALRSEDNTKPATSSTELQPKIQDGEDPMAQLNQQCRRVRLVQTTMTRIECEELKKEVAWLRKQMEELHIVNSDKEEEIRKLVRDNKDKEAELRSCDETIAELRQSVEELEMWKASQKEVELELRAKIEELEAKVASGSKKEPENGGQTDAEYKVQAISYQQQLASMFRYKIQKLIVQKGELNRAIQERDETIAQLRGGLEWLDKTESIDSWKYCILGPIHELTEQQAIALSILRARQCEEIRRVEAKGEVETSKLATEIAALRNWKRKHCKDNDKLRENIKELELVNAKQLEQLVNLGVKEQKKPGRRKPLKITLELVMKHREKIIEIAEKRSRLEHIKELKSYRVGSSNTDLQKEEDALREEIAQLVASKMMLYNQPDESSDEEYDLCEDC